MLIESCFHFLDVADRLLFSCIFTLIGDRRTANDSVLDADNSSSSETFLFGNSFFSFFSSLLFYCDGDSSQLRAKPKSFRRQKKSSSVIHSICLL